MRHANPQLKRARAKLEAVGVEIEWTTADVATYLQLSVRAVQSLCHRRQIPHRREWLPGRERPRYFFRQVDVEKWRAQHSEVIAVES